MARFSVSGLKDFSDRLKAAGDGSEQMSRDMLAAGAKVLVSTWKDVIQRRGLVDQKDMINSVKAKKPAYGKDDELAVEVYPLGVDEKYVRNAEKAFLHHYGYKSVDATHFVDEIEKEAAPLIEAAMEKIADEYLKE